MNFNKNLDTIIATDCEPDDLLAIWALFKNGINVSHIIVGEGNVFKKVVRMNYFIQLLIQERIIKNYTPVILAGSGSKKEFIGEGDAEGITFNNSINNQDEINSISVCRTISIYISYNSFSEMNYFALKPLRDFLQFGVCVLENLNVYAYGSFNFRTLGTKCCEIMMESFSKCKSVVIYETFLATGEQNSCTINNAGKKFHMDLRDNMNNDCIKKYIYDSLHAWNSHILKDCLDTMEEVIPGSTVNGWEMNFDNPEFLEKFNALSEKDQIRYDKRNFKTAKNVSEHNITGQFVFADIGLITTILSPSLLKPENVKTADISFSKYGFTTPVDNPDSNIQFIVGLNINEAIFEMIKLLLD